MDSHWAVIGGRNLGVYKKRPFIPCGFRSEPFPIALKCDSQMQASRIQSSLQGLMRDITDNATPVDAALTFYHDPVVAGLFKGHKKFYTVVIGHESGIFLYWEDCRHAVTGFSSPCFKKLTSLADALEFLITKAHRLGNTTDISSPRASALQSLFFQNLSLDDDSLGDAPNTLGDAPNMSNINLPPPPTRNSTCAWRMPTNASTPTPKTIYQHVCEIDSICGTLDQPQFDDTPLPSFGHIADCTEHWNQPCIFNTARAAEFFNSCLKTSLGTLPFRFKGYCVQVYKLSDAEFEDWETSRFNAAMAQMSGNTSVDPLTNDTAPLPNSQSSNTAPLPNSQSSNTAPLPNSQSSDLAIETNSSPTPTPTTVNQPHCYIRPTKIYSGFPLGV
ncbi:hypothetical protein F4604DRAFT_1991831 [Suillus subluteus]|nr:hypothetical protein F4604DRAFT_1991831 [Suillus subluteus]